MTEAPLFTADIAMDKAFTAAAFAIPTAALAEALARHPPHVAEALARRPRLVTLAGGMPVFAEGHLLAAIGVSGGSEDQDVACAAAGLTAIGPTCVPPDSTNGTK
jgi:uncharacterized protein GlcG (DUF336 family)